MFYRETGQFKTNYSDDRAIFPIAQDRYGIMILLAIAFFVIPFTVDDYWGNAIFLPLLIYALIAMGLNVLVGYCGQISLGTAAFMAVGSYASFKLMTSFPGLDFSIVVLMSGLITAVVGSLFGLPSLRIKGFYLAVATLAAQFFIIWLVNKVEWFYNYSATGQINAPERTALMFPVTGPNAPILYKYFFCLIIVVLAALVTKNIVRGRIGRQWMAIRDMDIAAELIGVRPLTTKLSAFAVSSFLIGMGGALYFGVWLGAAEPTEAFGIDQSFLILFMIIVGGLGTILGSFLGAAFLWLFPIAFKNFMVDGLGLSTAMSEHLQIILMGGLIIFFLIVEPHGLARLWQITKEKLRIWPFPH
ncbi:MAG: branched-chain amino acid ABC transporter permease [Cohaesibacter sp.]|nr:branched-chain amino acid ABC transporter permease [Cohaesibacter sp.]